MNEFKAGKRMKIEVEYLEFMWPMRHYLVIAPRKKWPVGK